MDEEKNKKVPIDMKRDASKQELLLALIQHGSRPAGWVLISLIVLIAVLWVREPLFRVIGSAKELRLGNYVYLKAERAGVSSELKKLATLTTDQIQLFLIIGRSRPGHHITYGGPESNEENYSKLKQIDLIENLIIKKNPDTGKKDMSWRLTEQGAKLHDLLMREVIRAVQISESE